MYLLFVVRLCGSPESREREFVFAEFASLTRAVNREGALNELCMNGKQRAITKREGRRLDEVGAGKEGSVGGSRRVEKCTGICSSR